MARKQVRQRRPVLEFVVLGEEQGVPHEVRGEETKAENEGGEQPLIRSRRCAGEPPRADTEEQSHTEEEQAQAGRGVSVARQGVGHALHQQPDACQRDDGTESRARRWMSERRERSALDVAGCSCRHLRLLQGRHFLSAVVPTSTAPMFPDGEAIIACWVSMLQRRRLHRAGARPDLFVRRVPAQRTEFRILTW